MEIRIGDLRQRVMIEVANRTSDGGGGADDVWGLVAEVWAYVKPLTGSERVEADAVAGRVSHEVWLRYRDDVEPEMRVNMDGRLFDIRAVLNVEERDRFLRCFVEELDL